MTSTKTWHLLVVDDDPLIGDSLKLILPKNWRITKIQDPNLTKAKYKIDAAMVDMHFNPDKTQAEGPKAIEHLLLYNPGLEVIAMSGDQSLELMELCLKKGASRFLAKPLIPEEVLQNLDKIEAKLQIKNPENVTAKARWVGNSKTSQKVLSTLTELRGEGGPILIEGPTGAGKEVCFEILHEQEPKPRPKITVNISAIPDTLFESELFGHVKGAFTGADQLKVGLAEAAHGGDLFLDEIEALSPSNQVKLLRFLESGEVRRVGGKESLMIDTRVTLASNENLKALVSTGKFREDLYFRISGKRVELPPLKDRREDIPDLVEYFLELERPRRNKSFTSEALAHLQSYDFPGNVRELKRIVEQVSLISPLPKIRKEDIDPFIARGGQIPHPQTEIMNISRGLSDLLSEFEKQILQMTLAQEPDIDKAANLLKISRSSLYKKIKDHALEVRSQ